jgi:hypothetical protein
MEKFKIEKVANLHNSAWYWKKYQHAMVLTDIMGYFEIYGYTELKGLN